MLPFALPFVAGARDVGLLALLGFFQLGLPCILMVTATRHLAPTEVALLALLEVLLGPLWAWLGAGEVPASSTWPAEQSCLQPCCSTNSCRADRYSRCARQDVMRAGDSRPATRF